MRLGRQYGNQRLEAACLRANHLKAFSYRTIKNILSSGFDRRPIESPETTPSTPGPHHENIRGPAYYLNQPEKP